MAEQQHNWLTWLCTCTGERRRPQPRCCCISMGQLVNGLPVYFIPFEAAFGWAT